LDLKSKYLTVQSIDTYTRRCISIIKSHQKEKKTKTMQACTARKANQYPFEELGVRLF